MINVMASLAIKEAYLELVPRFEKQSGHRVATIWAGMVDIKKRLLAGESIDMVIGSAAAVDELIKLGKLAPGSRVDLAKSSVAVAVRAGAPKPDISSGEALKRTLLAAKSIAYSSGPSGVYLSGVLERWGIPKGRITQTPPGAPVGEVLASGQAQIGFQQLSELLPIAGIDIVGPLPPDLQLVTTFSAGVHVDAKEAAAVKKLLAFFKAPAAVPVLKQKGMEPI
jgi:molybdate transport system substrate-binding protein